MINKDVWVEYDDKSIINNKGCIIDLIDIEYTLYSQVIKRPSNKKIYSKNYVLYNKSPLHRLIMGVNDPKIVVDHINGNGLDNRRCNLRKTSTQNNLINRKTIEPTKYIKSSKYRGVSKSKNSWKLDLQIKNQRFTKLLKSELKAARLYDVIMICLAGDYCVTNFSKIRYDVVFIQKFQKIFLKNFLRV